MTSPDAAAPRRGRGILPPVGSLTGASTMFPNRWITAGATAAWMLFFLAPEPRLAWLALPACVLAMLVMPERPIVATAIVLASSELIALDGLPFGDVEILLPTFASLNWLGRSGRPIPIGLIAVAGFTLTSMQRPSLWLSALLSAGTVYGIAWGFGALVHRRAVAAAGAVRVSERAAAVDIEELATASAAGERRRLENSTVRRLRDTLSSIARLARSEREHPERAPLGEIRSTADGALADLHEDLETLTGDRPVRPAHPNGASSQPDRADRPSPPVATPASGHLPPGETPASLAGRIAVGTAIAAAGTATMLVGTALLGGEWTRLAYLLLAALLPLAAVVARATPLLSAALAAVALIGAALDMPHAPEALVPTGAALLALCWRLASSVDLRLPWRDDWRTYIAVGVTVASGVVLGVQHGRSSAGFVVLAALLAVVGAQAWGERDRVTQAEEARAARLVARAATARLDAERNERRGIARDLHDVVSHAIVGISLQAQVATSVDGAARRAALDTIAEVAAASSRELGAFAEALGPGAS
ncbi:MAG: histidine kinase dimerization/phosphoacceptor domain-containing protein, partial [Pseudoclavibacter sp.]